MPASIADIRINGLDPTTTTIYSGMYPIFSWDFVEDVDSTTQARFNLRIGTSNVNLGVDAFNGNKLNIDVTSSVPYFEYILNNLARGYTYYGQVKAYDNETGTDHESNWLTFEFKVNQLPIVTSSSISPSHPTVIDNLLLTYTYYDADLQSESGTVIRWYNHNILDERFNDVIEIESQYLNISDSWTARIVPCDGLEYGPTVLTQAVDVIIAQINIDDIYILPKDANIDDFLKVEYVIADDPYLDLTNATTTYEWYVNGTQVSDVTQIVRLDLDANDEVYANVIVKDGDSILAQASSNTITIADASWKLFDLQIAGSKNPIGITELNPLIEWKRHKTKSDADETPAYLRVMVTETQSELNPTFDTGYIEYTKDNYLFTSDVFHRGKRYFVHVYAGDTTPFTEYLSKEVIFAGSSWSENVDNSVGWTVEFKAKLSTNSPGERQGIYIHDGKYFCSLFFSIDTVDDAGTNKIASRIAFSSGTEYGYNLIEPEAENSFISFQTFRITGFGKSVKVYLNNKLVLNLTDVLTISSLLKEIQFGNVDGDTHTGTWKFIRYSTTGAYGIGDSTLLDSNEFDFYDIANLPNGSIDCMMMDAIPDVPDNREDFPSSFIVGWKPNTGSTQLLGFNENGEELTLAVATKNYSPITTIKVDKNNNKYIGTSNGITVLYGSKHVPDYELVTDGTFEIKPEDFDQITNLPANIIPLVVHDTSDAITIDTTYNTLGTTDDPYHIQKGIFYFSQRTHGHAWFDNVDNIKGWQTEFTLNIGTIEQDISDDEDLTKQGVGVYVNDGVHQEIIIFSKSRVTLSYANVYADLNTGYRRTYRIVGKGESIKIYQRYTSSSAGTEQLLIDGTGLFTTDAAKTGNSQKSRIALDAAGYYHAVWHDDSSRTSNLFYSKYNGTSWSNPEVVIESAPFSLKNPDIATDSANNVYVVYEDLSYGYPEISCSIRDNVGWNPKIRVTNSASHKTKPRVVVDHTDSVHVVWEDHRNGKPEIFWAYRSKQFEAWLSSAQFTEDANIVSQSNVDAEMTGKGMSFSNPAICFVYPRVHVACEGNFGDGTSAIYTSYYDTLDRIWYSSGYPQNSTSGNLGISKRVSGLSRKCVNPDISALYNIVCVVWEDQTEPISQIWGNSYFSSTNADFSGVTKITARASDCKNPSVGYSSSTLTAAIVFESQEPVASSEAAISSDGTLSTSGVSQLFVDIFNMNSGLFYGSATGYIDEIILIESDKTCKNAHLPKVSPTGVVRVTYNYYKTLTTTEPLSEEEHPIFWLIGDATLDITSNIATYTINTTDIGTISSLLTKEFAFGDIDDTIGVQMEMRNISMYFGYDAKPLTVLYINKTSVTDWPDNRIYDLYVDVYGNILAGTYSGLAYYDLSNASVQMIKINPDSELTDYTIKAIDFLSNGLWIVGTTDFVSYSYDGGQSWHKISTITGVNSICGTSTGTAIIGTTNGIYSVSFNFENQISQGDIHEEPIHITNLTATDSTTDDNVIVAKIDEANIIWAGTNSGIVRIENYTNKYVINTNNGMRSNYVTDIAIIDKGTRYIATLTGIEKMTGFKFDNISVLNKPIASDNILSINYYADTKSLWFGSVDKLYELIFRDPSKESIAEELVEYASELLMDETVDRLNNYILDFDDIVGTSDVPFELTTDSTKVTINKNIIDFGYSVDSNTKSIIFEVSPLEHDQIEVIISNKFKLLKSFDQSSIEEEILGPKITQITKLLKTPNNQLMALAGSTNSSIMAYIGLSNLPFALITLDREKPIAKLEAIKQLDKTTYQFKVTASDQISGVKDMVLSNYSNFTTDGTTAKPYEMYQNYVIHDIGDQLYNTTTELEFPSTVEINAVTYDVGKGKLISVMKPSNQNNTYVYAFTTKPVIVYRLDPTTEEWEAISTLDSGNINTEIHSTLVVNDIMYITTGNDSDIGRVYSTTNGSTFTLVGTADTHIYCSKQTDNGMIYFGTDGGHIYEYSTVNTGGVPTFSLKYSNIGEKVLGLEYNNNILYATTENHTSTGSGFQIDLTNDNVLPMFPKSIEILSEVKLIGNSMYIVASGNNEIWRSDYIVGEPLDFMKSYSTADNTSIGLYSIPNEVLTETFQTS